jgi:hypothetical protein
VLKRLSPLKTDKYAKEKLFVVDVETYKLEATPENLWFGCIYGWNYRAMFRTVDEFKQIIKQNRFNGSYIFAHNGGGFDYLVLFGNIAKDNEVIWRGSKFISKKTVNDVTFGDSWNVLVGSVANIGKAIGIEKKELKGKGRIKRGTLPSETDIDYCYTDCEIIWHGLDSVFEKAGKICMTVASLSMRIFRRHYLHKFLVTDVGLDTYFLDAYYGGRVEAFRRGKVYAHIADVNSMYPYVMLHGKYPDPTRLKMKVRPAKKKLASILNQYEGCGHFTIKTSNSNIPILPIKEDNMLMFKNGILTGWWCFNEIREALKYGAEILKCSKVVYAIPFYGYELFGPYVNTHYELKQNGIGFENYYAKMMLTNLYGKFGEHKQEERLYFPDKKDIPKYMQLENDFSWTIHEFSARRKDGYITKEKLVKDKNTTLFCIAAYVTANARLHLYRLIKKTGLRNVLYCDTDSLFIPPGTKITESKKLGDLKLERDKTGKLKVITSIKGAKDYRVKRDGEIEEKIKGVPKSAIKIGPNKFRFKKLLRAREALTRNRKAGKLITVEKNLTRKYKKRYTFANGKTRPFKQKA